MFTLFTGSSTRFGHKRVRSRPDQAGGGICMKHRWCGLGHDDVELGLVIGVGGDEIGQLGIGQRAVRHDEVSPNLYGTASRVGPTSVYLESNLELDPIQRGIVGHGQITLEHSGRAEITY